VRQLRTEFSDKGQLALAGCSETWAQWTDVRAATDRKVPAQMKTMTS